MDTANKVCDEEKNTYTPWKDMLFFIMSMWHILGPLEKEHIRDVNKTYFGKFKIQFLKPNLRL